MSCSPDNIGSWEMFDTVIQVFNPSLRSEEKFIVLGGECETSDGDRLLRFLMIDRETDDVYKQSFNVSWCPDRQKEWLWQISVINAEELILCSKDRQKRRIANAWGNFCQIIKK